MRSVLNQLHDTGVAIGGICRPLGQSSCGYAQQQSSQLQRAQSPPDAG
jgi:hypothetical protein